MTRPILVAIEAESLYGHVSFRHEIPAGLPTVFAGPNESGKSSAIGLINLVLRGPAGTVWPMHVEPPTGDFRCVLSFADGTSVRRGMRGGAHGASVYTSLGIVENEKGKPLGVQAVTAEVTARYGLASTWSLDSLSTLTPAEQSRWFEEQLLRPLSPSMDELRAKLAAHVAPLAEIEADVLEALCADVESIAKASGRNVEDVARERLWAGPADTFLARLGAIIDAAHLFHDRRAKTALAAAGQSPSTRPDVEGGRSMWQARVAELNEEIEAASRIAGDSAQLVKDLDFARGKLIAPEKITAAEEKATATSAAQIAAQTALETARSTARAKASEADAAESARRQASEQLAEAVRVHEIEQARANAANTLAESLEALATAIRPIAESLGNPDRVQLALLPAPTMKLRTLASNLVAVSREHLDPLVALAAAGAPDRPSTDAVDAATTMAEVARRSANRAAEAERAATDALTRATKAAETARADLESVRTKAETASRTVADLESRLGAGAGAVERVEQLQTERVVAQQNINKLIDHETREHSRQQLAVTRTTAEAQRSRLFALKSRVRDLVGRLLAEVDIIGRVQATATEITREVINADVTVSIDAGKGLRMGLSRGGRNLGHGSSSARAVLYAAMAVAIGVHLPGWRHAEVDDLERLETKRLTAFLNAVARQMREGRLDGFFGGMVLTDGAPTPEADVHWIRLSPVDGAA